MALRRARERGVANAGEAIRSVEQKGPRSYVVRAIVRRLAAELWAVVVPDEEAIDINSSLDLVIAEAVMTRRATG